MADYASPVDRAESPTDDVARRRYRFIGVFVLAVAAALFTLGAWAVSSPVGSMADDDFHVASIWCRSAAGAEQCLPGGPSSQDHLGVVKYQVPQATSICHAWNPAQSGDCPVLENPIARTSDWLYPPLFYSFASNFAGATPSDGVAVIRIAVAVVVVAIFSLAYLVALPWLRAPMLLSWVIGSMPFGLALYASTSPSSWAVAGVAAMWGPMVTAYLTTGWRRWAAIAVWWAAALMAAGSRGDAALYVIGITGLGMLLMFAKQRWPVLIASVVPIVVGAVFFLRSGQSRLASGSFVDKLPQVPRETTLWSMAEAWPTYWAALTGAPWGRTKEADMLGWIDMPMPSGVWMSTTLLLGGFLLAGLGVMYWRKGVAVAVLAVVVVAIPTRSLLQSEVLGGTLFQPRYVLPLLLAWLGVMLVARPGERLNFSRTQLVAAGLLFAYASAIALHAWLRRFVTGVDVVDVNLNRATEWWPYTTAAPMTVWIVGSVAWMVLIVIAFGHYWPKLTVAQAATAPRQP
jgi:hypothetical protein